MDAEENRPCAGGLHDRLTQTIRLLPFTLAETREFFQGRKIEFPERHLVELYMIFGGVRHYLDLVDRGGSVAQYVDVVRALSARRRGLSRNELLEKIALPSGGGATRILEGLEEGGFITSTIPFGRNSRDRFFRLTDEFSLFHLKWIEAQGARSWQQERKTPRWQAWAGLAFESVCLEHVEAIHRALGIAGVRTSVSAWLHEGAQIDLLIDRADDVVSVCEVKFSDEPFPNGYSRMIESMSRRIWLGLQTKSAECRAGRVDDRSGSAPFDYQTKSTTWTESSTFASEQTTR